MIFRYLLVFLGKYNLKGGKILVMKDKTKSTGFKNFIKNFKKPTWLLSLAMVLVLVGSVIAQMYNTTR